MLNRGSEKLTAFANECGCDASSGTLIASLSPSPHHKQKYQPTFMSEPHSFANNLSDFFVPSRNGWMNEWKAAPPLGGFYILQFIFSTPWKTRILNYKNDSTTINFEGLWGPSKEPYTVPCFCPSLFWKCGTSVPRPLSPSCSLVVLGNTPSSL